MTSINTKKRHPADVLLYIAIYICAAFSVALLLGIILYVLIKGIRSVSWDFLTGVTSVLKGTTGIAGNIVNTLYIIVVTMLIATPVGVGAAVYLNEYAKPGKLVSVIEFATETLAGIQASLSGIEEKKDKLRKAKDEADRRLSEARSGLAAAVQVCKELESSKTFTSEDEARGVLRKQEILLKGKEEALKDASKKAAQARTARANAQTLISRYEEEIPVLRTEMEERERAYGALLTQKQCGADEWKPVAEAYDKAAADRLQAELENYGTGRFTEGAGAESDPPSRGFGSIKGAHSAAGRAQQRRHGTHPARIAVFEALGESSGREDGYRDLCAALLPREDPGGRQPPLPGDVGGTVRASHVRHRQSRRRKKPGP